VFLDLQTICVQLKSAKQNATKPILCANESELWPGLEIRTGLREGRGVFTKVGFKKGHIVCNYGAQLLNISEVQKLSFSERNYLLEFSVVKRCYRLPHYMHYNCEKDFTFGELVNQSSRHPVLCHKVHLRPDGTPDVHFIAKCNIPPNTELCYNYGPTFKGVGQCVVSCSKCRSRSKRCIGKTLIGSSVMFQLYTFHTDIQTSNDTPI
jgi:hypothetical protein